MRFTRIFGPEPLLCLGDLFYVLMPATNPAGWASWVVISAELLMGSAITYYGFIRLGRKKTQEKVLS